MDYAHMTDEDLLAIIRAGDPPGLTQMELELSERLHRALQEIDTLLEMRLSDDT